MSGSRVGAFNNSTGWLEMPERENLGTLFVWANLSSFQGARTLQVEGTTNGVDWIDFGTRDVTSSTEYQLLSWTIDHPGPMVLRLSRTGSDDQTIYFDDISLTARAPWTNVEEIPITFDNAVDDSGIYQYRSVVDQSHPEWDRGTNYAEVGTLLLTNAANIAIPEGVITGFVFAVDADNDRPNDRLRNAGIPYVARVDRTPPNAVEGLAASRADLQEYLGFEIDESSEIVIQWDQFSSEAVAAGPRESDNLELSPWDTYIITYYEVDANTNPIPGVVTNVITGETADWTETLRQYDTTDIILSNVVFDTYYRIGVQGRDEAGNVGPIEWTLGSTDRFIVTQGLASAATQSDIFWRATEGREYDLLSADHADYGDHMQEHHRWNWLDTVAANWARDSDALSTSDMRFYRATPKGRAATTQRPVASEEVYVAVPITVHRGQNWVAFPGIPDTNTIGRIFNGARHLPRGGAIDATRVTWYHRASGESVMTNIYLASDEEWYGIADGTPPNVEDLTVDLSDGVVIEIPMNSPSPSYTFLYVGRVPSPALTNHIQTQTIVATNAYNLLNFRLPRRMHPSELNLVVTNSAGLVDYGMTAGIGVSSTLGTNRADAIWALSREEQGPAGYMYYHDGLAFGGSSGGPGWYWVRDGGPSSANRVLMSSRFAPDDAIVLRSFGATEDWIWTNTIPYSAPHRVLWTE